ncbi:acyl-CoA transferase [Mycobacterium avium subsp. hominissuis 10-5606]|nr:acyl-CoA transferase [Mycobacterium avium subsp. hominissuis 10-5606]
MTNGALAGLRVLDAASLLAAPLISSVLADHGADVVRLEPPGGDPYRESARHLWALTARRKRSLVLDLNTIEGRQELHSVVPAIDAVVVNEPTNRLRRRGLDHETLEHLNAGLIYVHVSGFGLDGPAADRPGNGTLAEAYSGLTHMTGDPDGPPVLPSVPLGDAVTAYVGAFGVLTAWYQRQLNGGVGQVVDVNPVDAMLHITAPLVSGFDETAPPPHRLGSRMADAALRNVFATRGGEWVAVSVSTPRQELSVRDLVGAAASEDAEDALRRWTATRSRDEVLAAMYTARIPVAPVKTAHDIVADPHLQYRNAIEILRYGDGAPIGVPAPAPRLQSAGPPSGQLSAIGEHTAEVLQEWRVRLGR